MTPQYTQEQIAFCLSLFSNFASATRGSQAELQQMLTKDLTTLLDHPGIVSLLGPWKLVWGPVVFVPDGIQQQQANATFIAEYQGKQPGADGESIPDYVIATAGTNPLSFFGWLVEDFQVVSQAPWRFGDAEGLQPMISEGTSKGLTIISEIMKDEGATVIDFFATLNKGKSQPYTISVVGHSLGGALSSTLALKMVDLQSEWDPQGLATIITAPSAGPTAGDKDFAEYYDQRLGDRTNRIWNAVDIVPHAWEAKQLEQIPGIYKSNIPVIHLLTLGMQVIVKRTKAGRYKQIAGNGNKLPGKYSEEPYEDSNAESQLDEIKKFVIQAGFQHTTAYQELLGVTDLITLSEEVLNRDALVIEPSDDWEALLKRSVENVDY